MNFDNIISLDLFDKSKRAQLRKDPKGLLTAHGIEIDNTAEYVVNVESQHTYYFVIPKNTGYQESVLDGLSAAGARRSSTSTVCSTFSTVDTGFNRGP